MLGLHLERQLGYVGDLLGNFERKLFNESEQIIACIKNSVLKLSPYPVLTNWDEAIGISLIPSLPLVA